MGVRFFPKRTKPLGGLLEQCGVVEGFATKHSEGNQFFQLIAHWMMFMGIQIHRALFQIVMYMKLIESAGERTAFPVILWLHPFDDSFLVD
jgi:hypothetical protein